MIICSCNAISDTSVKASIHSDKCPRTPGAVYRCLGCRPNCGRCLETVRAIIDEALTQASELAGTVAEAGVAVANLDEHRHAHARAHEAASCTEDCEACAAAAA